MHSPIFFPDTFLFQVHPFVLGVSLHPGLIYTRRMYWSIHPISTLETLSLIRQVLITESPCKLLAIDNTSCTSHGEQSWT